MKIRSIASRRQQATSCSEAARGVVLSQEVELEVRVVSVVSAERADIDVARGAGVLRLARLDPLRPPLYALAEATFCSIWINPAAPCAGTRSCYEDGKPPKIALATFLNTGAGDPL
jgi:hypothetical protein